MPKRRVEGWHVWHGRECRRLCVQATVLPSSARCLLDGPVVGGMPVRVHVEPFPRLACFPLILFALPRPLALLLLRARGRSPGRAVRQAVFAIRGSCSCWAFWRMWRSGVECVRRVWEVFRGRGSDYRGNRCRRCVCARAGSIALVLECTNDFIHKRRSVWQGQHRAPRL